MTSRPYEDLLRSIFGEDVLCFTCSGEDDGMFNHCLCCLLCPRFSLLTYCVTHGSVEASRGRPLFAGKMQELAKQHNEEPGVNLDSHERTSCLEQSHRKPAFYVDDQENFEAVPSESKQEYFEIRPGNFEEIIVDLHINEASADIQMQGHSHTHNTQPTFLQPALGSTGSAASYWMQGMNNETKPDLSPRKQPDLKKQARRHLTFSPDRWRVQDGGELPGWKNLSPRMCDIASATRRGSERCLRTVVEEVL